MTTLREAATMALEALEFPAASFPVDRHKAAAALRAALAEPVQEPVAWTYEWKHRLHGGSLNVSRARWPESHLWIETPLYAAPPQRTPLTEEEIQQCFKEAGIAIKGQHWTNAVRAIERAHGIG